MKIRGGSAPIAKGFTIIEVMIVLSVMGAMLVVATRYVSGQQAKTEFNVGARLLSTKIRTVMNEAGSGYYPNAGNVVCQEYLGTGVAIPKVTSGTSTPQGSNTDCMYLGNMLVFGPDTTGVPNTPLFSHVTNYRILPMVGLRTYLFWGVTRTESVDLKTAHAHAIAPTHKPFMTDIANLSSNQQLPNGLRYVGALDDGVVVPVSTPVALFATMSFHDRNGWTGQVFQGSQQLELRKTTNPNLTGNLDEANRIGVGTDQQKGDQAIANWIDAEWLHGALNAGFNVFPVVTDTTLCFASSGTNQSVAIGFKNGSTEPSYAIKEGTKCGIAGL